MSLPTPQTVPYRDHFDQWVSYYDSNPEITAIKDTIDITHKTVVETACGTGRLSFELAPETTQYIGFDEDPRLITKATEKHHNWKTPLSFSIAPQEYMPLQDNTADVIISSWGTDHTTIGHILTEYDRVLKPGGSLIIIEEAWTNPDTTSDYERLLRHIHPGHSFYDPQSRIARVITGAYDDPVTEQLIETTYTYPSMNAAIDAITFHVTGSKDECLSHKQQSQLELMLGGFEQLDGRVTLSEQVTLSHYILDP